MNCWILYNDDMEPLPHAHPPTRSKANRENPSRISRGRSLAAGCVQAYRDTPACSNSTPASGSAILPFLPQLPGQPNSEASQITERLGDDPQVRPCGLATHARQMCHRHLSGRPFLKRLVGARRPPDGDALTSRETMPVANELQSGIRCVAAVQQPAELAHGGL